MATTKTKKRTNGKTAVEDHLVVAPVGKNRISTLVQIPKKSAAILVPALQVGLCSVEIVGTSNLLVHRFSEKARRQMEEKQQQAATKAKDKRDPDADYFGAMYIISGDPRKDEPGLPSSKCKAVHGMPAGGVKNAMVRGAKAAGAVMSDCRGSFFILPDGKCDRLDMVKLDFDSVSRNDGVVVLQGASKDLRYRPEYFGWKALLRIEYNTSQIGIPQLVNLLRLAGFGVGLCEWRPECSGTHGRFTTGAVTDLGTKSI